MLIGSRRRLFLYCCIGIGKGSTELVTNYTMIGLEKQGRSRLINLVHAFFGVGAILPPWG